MPDTTEYLNNSLIQHGPDSQRIYLMKLAEKDCPEITGKLDELAVSKGYTKIFAKIPKDQACDFLDSGYRIEAEVPDFYKGQKSALFLGKYFDDRRMTSAQTEKIQHILNVAQNKAGQARHVALPANCKIEKAQPEDVEEIADVYKQVFETYPFPIHDPAYLAETMESHIEYYIVKSNEDIIAVASSEMDLNFQNVEMTDFATLPAHRGKGLAISLLLHMDEKMRQKPIETAYTIARAISAGMNITFAKAGYSFAGTLINNTGIAGSIEDMNIWYKKLQN